MGKNPFNWHSIAHQDLCDKNQFRWNSCNKKATAIVLT
jgi:hypothetical protein